MTTREESRRLFNECKHLVKKGLENTVPYVSGTLEKKRRMYKNAERYREDAVIDFELGVINQEEYNIEIKAVQLFERMLANYIVY